MYKILVISIAIILSMLNVSYAEKKIAFINIDRIINQSDAGKKSYIKIDKNYKKEKEKLQKTEKNLISKEQEILKQKNILSKEELDKKVKSFQAELSKLRKEKIEFNRNIIKKNKDATNKMVNEINKILTQYASDNSVSLVIQKKNIIIGKTELDITPEILKEFNNKVKSIN